MMTTMIKRETSKGVREVLRYTRSVINDLGGLRRGRSLSVYSSRSELAEGSVVSHRHRKESGVNTDLRGREAKSMDVEELL